MHTNIIYSFVFICVYTLLICSISGDCASDGFSRSRNRVEQFLPQFGGKYEGLVVENSHKRNRRWFRPKHNNVNSDSDEEDLHNVNTRSTKQNAPKQIPWRRITVQVPEDYSIYDIPKDIDNKPLPLFVYVQIINILDIDELNEMVNLDIEFSVKWTDYKILYFNNMNSTINPRDLPTYHNLTRAEINKSRVTMSNPFLLDTIWKPNLFIENLLSVKQPTVMSHPLTIKYIPHVGWFEYITRLNVKMDCEMDFHYYPADTQGCEFSIRGFSYPQHHLNLNWFESGVYLDDLSLPSFDVKVGWTNKVKLTVHKNSNNDPDDEVFDVLRFKIMARRNLSYHFVQTYLASTFYIAVTTLCFVLPARLVEARIGISMTTLLTLTAMFASVRESSPVVSYVKALDIWMFGCIFFVFLTLSMFTFETWAKGDTKAEDQKVKRDNNVWDDIEQELEELKKSLNKEIRNLQNRSESWSSSTDEELTEHKSNSESPKSMVDLFASLSEKFSFPFFLTVFALYTALYWTWLLNSADYFNWTINGTLNNLVHPEDP